MDKDKYLELKERYRLDASELVKGAKSRKNKEIYFVSKPFYARQKKADIQLSESRFDEFKNIVTGNTKLDGWMNLLTGLGGNRDKATFTTFYGYNVIDDRLLAELWVGDGYAKKISKVFADDATREWISIKNDTENILLNKLSSLKAYKHFNLALSWQRHFGGALIVMGINDGGNIEDEVNPDNIKSIDFLRVYDRVHVYLTNFNFSQDPNSKDYGEPEYYTVIPKWSAPFNVHKSRVLVFKGIEVPDWMQTNNWWYWGMSVLQPIWNDLKNLSAAINHIVKLLYEFSITRTPIKGLQEMMAEDDWEDSIKDILSVIELGKSTINSYIYDAESEAPSRESVNVSGLSDLLDRYMVLLCGSGEIPMTKLFGRSVGGISAAGSADKDQEDHYDSVRAFQKNEMQSPLQTLTNFINISKEITKKITDPIIEFNPLKQQTETEKIANRKVQMEIDTGYINAGVYDNYTVTKSRFENGYSFETDVEVYVGEVEKELNNPEEPDNQQIESTEITELVEGEDKKVSEIFIF